MATGKEEKMAFNVRNTKDMMGNAGTQPPAPMGQAGGDMPERGPVIRRNAELSPSLYVAIIALLVTSGFSLITVGSFIFGDSNVVANIPEMNSLTVLIASIAALVVGLLIQWRGAKVESAPLCLVGFYIISCVFGCLVALILPLYDIPTITSALAGTVIIAIVFGVLGFAFPSFFEQIHGPLITALIGVIIAEIVFFLLGISQGVTDWIVLVIFCGLIGYDFYKAMHVPKTKINAIMFATSIYLDLLNVFLRLLSILGRKK